MFKISTHIYNELKGSNIEVKKIEPEKRVKILDSIVKKYIDINRRGIWLWEKFVQYETLSDDMAWSYIGSFVKDNDCIMFFNQDEEKEMFLIQGGNALNYILSETYGFEFYITDKESSYLICFNHHNILYGCGIAEKWIKNMQS